MGLFKSVINISGILIIFFRHFQVYNFVGLTELYYAGSHGMDIMGPVNKSKFVNDHPNCIRSTDKQVSKLI